ncbi:MAG: class I SAM-dependent methyltransferase [Pyrinomonadaceae bacterium]|nr:class I SAM-dependent methyltransferase [Pyrinomonadaceae bacterium]
MQPTYDRFAKFYDRLFAPFEKRFLARWRAETLAELPKNAEILEVGCGTGANFAFYPQSRRAVSSELSHEMLHIAVTRRHSNHLLQTDVQSLPFPANSFDAAFATLVFCSVPDPAAGFAELRRVVRPGGRIVLLEHVRPEGFLGSVFDVVSAATVALIDDHFNRRTAEIAAKSGLIVTEIRRKAAGAVNLIICENIKASEIPA